MEYKHDRNGSNGSGGGGGARSNGNGAGGAPGDPNSEQQLRKIFIGGLTSTTTEDTLRAFYGVYGELVDVIVMRDPVTKRSRGFGFVTYATTAQVDAAMAARPHVVDGKTVDPKRAVPREASGGKEEKVSSKRLYVSGVRDDHNEEMLTSFFSEFGNVLKVEIISDKVTGKPRGFAFVNFDDYDAVDKCVIRKSHMINGHRCDVKKAMSKEDMARSTNDRDRSARGDRSRDSYSSPSRGGRDSRDSRDYRDSRDRDRDHRDRGGRDGYGGGGGGGGYGDHRHHGSHGPDYGYHHHPQQHGYGAAPGYGPYGGGGSGYANGGYPYGGYAGGGGGGGAAGYPQQGYGGYGAAPGYGPPQSAWGAPPQQQQQPWGSQQQQGGRGGGGGGQQQPYGYGYDAYAGGQQQQQPQQYGEQQSIYPTATTTSTNESVAPTSAWEQWHMIHQTIPQNGEQAQQQPSRAYY